MSGDVTRDHYDRLAEAFDENWAHSPEYVKWMADCIARRLKITGSDLVTDIGCGTGLYTRGLAERAATVVCIEPSAAMLRQVPRGGNVLAVQGSAEDLADGRIAVSHGGYDAMLLKEVLHHVADPAEVIAGLARLLKPAGRILVVMLPAKISYPLFGAALKLFEERQPDPAGIADAMRTAGLEANLTYESFPLSFPAERYLQMVRSRYMSLLSSFDNDELEAGAAEIRAAYPGELIEFTDTFAFVLGAKP